MLISGINNYFERHKKWLLPALTLLLSLTFISFFTSGGFFSGGDSNSGVYAIVNGRPVNREEMYRHTAEMQLASMGQNTFTARVATDAFGIIIYEQAQQLGITVSDDEVKQFYTLVFADASGKFSKEYFENYIRTRVVPNGFARAELDGAVRKYLTIEKLLTSALTRVPAPVTFIENVGALNTTKYDVDVMWFRAEDYLAKAEVTDTQINNEYTQSVARVLRARIDVATLTDSLMNLRAAQNDATTEATAQQIESIQGRLQQAHQSLANAESMAPMTEPAYDVVVAYFPLANDTERNEIQVTDVELKAYFEKNKANFVNTDTEVTFEGVRSMVKDQYVTEIVKANAYTKASDFSNHSALEDLNDQDSVAQLALFTQIATDMGVELLEVTSFSRTSPNLPKVGVAFGLAEVLTLANDRNLVVTDPAESFNGVFVALIKNVTTPTIKPLEAVKAKITSDIKQREANALANAAAKNFSADATSNLLMGKEVTATAGAKFETLPTFSLDSMPEGNMYAPISYKVLSVPQGQVSDAFSADGNFAVIFVKKVTPPTMAEIEADVRNTENVKNVLSRAALQELFVELDKNFKGNRSE